MSPGPDSWQRAALATGLLLSDPVTAGGIHIRMRAGPARDRIIRALDTLAPRKIHPTISDEQLFGGLDLAGTLETGQVIDQKGIFEDSCVIVLTMGERCGADLAAKINLATDRSGAHCVIALDEGAEPEETLPPALSERLALFVSPEGRMPEDWAPVPAGTRGLRAADVSTTYDQIDALTALAVRFGISSLRAPTMALRVAQLHAALCDRDAVSDDDLAVAAALVYPQRATVVPQDETAEDQPPPPPEPDTADAPGDTRPDALPDGDLLVDAVKALLPADLLAGLVPAGTVARASGNGAGKARKGNRRGRPLPSRPGRLDGTSRIDLVATLRAAAPWQPVRRRATPDRAGLLIRPADIRLRRYQEMSDRLLIFAVDASGSAAVSRLNEAKGAVELLLAQAYAARDHVALISFRGTGAELLLPPTRSLVQTKRRLASLPGGGGTPLASGLEQAALLADQSRSRGLTPTVVLLTDGRANIALDGTPDRAAADADARHMARVLRARGTASLVIDMSKRPQEALRALSEALGAPYVPMPRADAQGLTGAVSAALGG